MSYLLPTIQPATIAGLSRHFVVHACSPSSCYYPHHAYINSQIVPLLLSLLCTSLSRLQYLYSISSRISTNLLTIPTYNDRLWLIVLIAVERVPQVSDVVEMHTRGRKPFDLERRTGRPTQRLAKGWQG